jgi:hypothetical protein
MPESTAPNGHTNETFPQETQDNGWRAFATLTQFLKDDGWYPQQLDEKTIHRVYFAGKNGELRCYAQVRVDLEQLLFYVIAPVKTPEPMFAHVAEYITRANYGLRIGNFEMDYTDGEVRYKSSFDFEGELLTPKLIKNAMYPAVHTMDLYLPGLLGVMYGNKTPAEAIRDTED